MEPLEQKLLSQLPAWAAWVGAHALPVFLALLAALLLATALVWWGLHRHVLPYARGSLPRPAVLALFMLAGFGIVAGAAAVFAEIAEHLGPGGAMAQADEALTAAIRTHTPLAALRVFAALTHLGDVLTLTLLAAAVALALALRRRFALALAWLLATGGNALLNPLLKRLFERVRPVHDHGLASELGWSFPSGHSSGAVVCYGMLAYLLLRALPPRHAPWHLPIVLMAAATAFTIGCSRVFLQVHFASDVAAGFASGTAWLTVCIASAELSRLHGRRLGVE